MINGKKYNDVMTKKYVLGLVKNVFKDVKDDASPEIIMEKINKLSGKLGSISHHYHILDTGYACIEFENANHFNNNQYHNVAYTMTTDKNDLNKLLISTNSNRENLYIDITNYTGAMYCGHDDILFLIRKDNRVDIIQPLIDIIHDTQDAKLNCISMGSIDHNTDVTIDNIQLDKVSVVKTQKWGN